MILYRNSNNPMPYPMEKGNATDGNGLGIEIEDDNTDDTVQPEYTSFSILYPYTLNGNKIYNQYGNPAGITLEVNKDGVTSINVQLLLFKGSIKKSEKMTEENTLNLIKNWGNSPFRGQQSEIKLNKPERAYVLFTMWRNNTSELYISSGIRFGSSIKADQRAQQPYEMIISDYKIGNNGSY